MSITRLQDYQYHLLGMSRCVFSSSKSTTSKPKLIDESLSLFKRFRKDVNPNDYLTFSFQSPNRNGALESVEVSIHSGQGGCIEILRHFAAGDTGEGGRSHKYVVQPDTSFVSYPKNKDPIKLGKFIGHLLNEALAYVEPPIITKDGKKFVSNS